MYCIVYFNDTGYSISVYPPTVVFNYVVTFSILFWRRKKNRKEKKRSKIHFNAFLISNVENLWSSAVEPRFSSRTDSLLIPEASNWCPRHLYNECQALTSLNSTGVSTLLSLSPPSPPPPQSSIPQTAGSKPCRHVNYPPIITNVLSSCPFQAQRHRHWIPCRMNSSTRSSPPSQRPLPPP